MHRHLPRVVVAGCVGIALLVSRSPARAQAPGPTRAEPAPAAGPAGPRALDPSSPAPEPAPAPPAPATGATERPNAEASGSAAPAAPSNPSPPAPPAPPAAPARETATPPEREPRTATAITPAAAAEAAEAPAPPAGRATGPTSAEPAPRADTKPLAGWHAGRFYLRDSTDSFRLYPSGRLQVDGYAPFGAGLTRLPAGSAMNPTLFVRRARLEFGAEFKKWQAVVMGEFGPTAIDNTNARGAVEECTASPTTGQPSCVPRGSKVDSPSQRAAIINAYINYAQASWLNMQVGQFRIPFTLEHRTGINVMPFMDRSLAVRLVGAPTGRDIGAMAWGEGPDKYFHYAFAVMTGDGADHPNVDARFDGLGRVVVRPFAGSPTAWLEGISIGGSLRAGSRDGRLVGYDVSPLTTQGGYAFWRATYRDSRQQLTHIIPSGPQLSYAAELYAPLGPFDLTSELVAIDHGTREAADTLQFSGTPRLGRMTGLGHYVQLGLWVLGSREAIPAPGHMRPPHVDFTKDKHPPEHSIQILAKVEQLRLEYAGAERRGTPDASSPDGKINVDAVGLGVNYFFARHVRTTLNYFYYSFPDSAPVTPSTTGGVKQTSEQRAVAPAQGLPKGVDDDARDHAHVLHELSLRVAIQF